MLKASAITRFKGLNNVTDPLRQDASWLVQADNVDITDTGGLAKRTGYTRALAATVISGAFATFDYARMYFVDNGALKVMTGPSTANTLQAGLSLAAMYFTEINDQVFYTNGTDSGVIMPDNTVLPWIWTRPVAPSAAVGTGALPAGLYQARCTFVLPDGRETGASDSAEITLVAGQSLQISGIPQQVGGGATNIYIAPADSSVYQYAASPLGTAMVWNTGPETLGRELLSNFLDPLPSGCETVQYWRGQIYAVQYFSAQDQSVIWRSEPLGFHLFDLDEEFFIVPGHALMLAPHADALIVGTDKAIYAYDGEKQSVLAPYGVVPGWHWSADDDRVIFWSVRGACAALPFVNLTERQVSVAPGVSAGGTVVRSGGQKRYLVSTKQGGSAFNLRP